MPTITIKGKVTKFPYTKKGKEAAMKAKMAEMSKSKKKVGGKMMKKGLVNKMIGNC